jgi:hypothetical protein
MTSDLDAKLAKLGQLHDARRRATDCHKREKAYGSALWVQQLDRQIAELRSLLPKPKLVVNNA